MVGRLSGYKSPNWLWKRSNGRAEGDEGREVATGQTDHENWASEAPVDVSIPSGPGSSADPDSGGLGQTQSLYS